MSSMRIPSDEPANNPRATTEPLSTGMADLEAIQARVEQLRALKALRDEEAILQRALSTARSPDPIRSPRDSRSSHRRRRSSSSSSSEREVRVKNITKLTATASFRQRDDWLADLQRAFEGASKRYRKDSRKILLALDHVDNELRSQWSRYARDELANTDPDWDTFTAWSLTILGIDQLAEVCKALDRARQRDHQSPAAFNNYLESLESHLPGPRDRDDVRAYKLYAKLSPTVRDQLDKSATTLPKTRQEMVALATRVWEAQKDHKPSGPTIKVAGGGPRASPSRSPGRDLVDSEPKRGGNQVDDTSQNTPTNQSTRSQESGLRTCYVCGRPGHIAARCTRRMR